jgi:hypothetical protein
MRMSTWTLRGRGEARSRWPYAASAVLENLMRALLTMPQAGFIGLFFLYVGITLAFSVTTFQGDEDRYVMFANNLVNGFYSPPDSINLWNGPGYPIILAPFAALGIPWIWAKLLNSLFLIIAVTYFWRTLRAYVPARGAYAAAILLGLYPPFLRELHVLLTETFVYFLVCGFLFYFSQLIAGSNRSNRLMLLSSVFLGYLALTKVIFGYIIALLFIISALGYLLKRKRERGLTALVSTGALIVCLPYLIYTYTITGRIFYWSNAGGMSLYWMSTPYENEYGDWFSSRDVAENPSLASHHGRFFSKLSTIKDGVTMDDRFKEAAVQNISAHPIKYFKNWLANVGRLLFSYPFSYTPQKLSTYFYLIPNSFLFCISMLLLYPYMAHWRTVPREAHFVFGLFLVSFAASSLLSAYDRQFSPLVPMLALWMAIVLMQAMAMRAKSSLALGVRPQYNVRKEEPMG